MNTQNHICVSDMRRETNERIYDRNIPSQPLQAYLDVRPVMTKYSYFPIVDPRKELTVPMIQMPTYNVNRIFNPGNTQSPWSGFATNVNLESELRNQVFALQKCSQAAYVPNSNSDLYKYSFHSSQNNVSNPHALLFKEESFCSFNPNPDNKIIGNGLFYNSTRTQLREFVDKTSR